jgi:xanthine dehydrogenase accessory factor
MFVLSEKFDPSVLGEFEDADRQAWDNAVKAAFANRSGHLLSIQLKSQDNDREKTRLQLFLTHCGPPLEAWIFGAGHIACALSPILAGLGWRVVVCDDRAEFVTVERFPDAAELRAGGFDESARVCAQRSETWLILVTRGHAHDQVILREFVTSREAADLQPPQYIGMIGSKRRVGTVRRQLSAQGFPALFLDNLHAPIGLPIGADSPGEIAIAIAAEMVALRRGRCWDHSAGAFSDLRHETAATADTAGCLDLWRRIASVLASGVPAVLATIVERRGSTPRGIGTQMAVFGNGAAIGTIGGGCGEGVVLRAAREMLLGSGQPRFLAIDLTGDQSSEAADVCGGRYSVFLEVLS